MSTVSVMMRWLFAPGGAGLSNIAQFLCESFAPAVPAATINLVDGTITAYPADRDQKPRTHGTDGNRLATHWTPAAASYTHPFNTEVFPNGTTAHHHIVVGVTSKRELLLLNLAALDDLAIETDNPLPMLRSWITQLLDRTPGARIETTDADLAIPGHKRLELAGQDELPLTPDPRTTVVIVEHARDIAASACVSIITKPVGEPENLLLTDGDVASIYVAGGRFFPLWRRIQISDDNWATYVDAHTPAPLEPDAAQAAEVDEGPPWMPDPMPAAPSPRPDQFAVPTAADHDPAAGALEQDPDPTTPARSAPSPTVVDESPAAETITIPTAAVSPAAPLLFNGAPLGGSHAGRNPVDEIDLPAPAAPATPVTVDEPPAAPPAAVPTGDPIEQFQRPGLYVLGPTFVAGAKRDGTLIDTPATSRQGIRKPVKGLMIVASHSGITSDEWGTMLALKPDARRAQRKQIREICGREVIVQEPGTDLLTLDNDVYCDWKEVQRITGPNPAAATTEDLAAAASLIRGVPFEGIDPAEYSWRELVLLRDRLTDLLSSTLLELGTRQADHDLALAYRTARRGLAINSDREDLWQLAARTAPHDERPGLLFDLREAIPRPQARELRDLIAAT